MGSWSAGCIGYETGREPPEKASGAAGISESKQTEGKK